MIQYTSLERILSRSQSKKNRLYPERENEYRHISKGVAFDYITDENPEYIIPLRIIRFELSDGKYHSYGELFFLLCDDVQDMELTDSLQSLMTLFVGMASGFSAAVTELIKSQVSNWIATQARFIRDMFSDLCWES